MVCLFKKFCPFYWAICFPLLIFMNSLYILCSLPNMCFIYSKSLTCLSTLLNVVLVEKLLLLIETNFINICLKGWSIYCPI